ncbi:MAG: P-type conjugative transfer ATPase TrbB [Azospirillum sp.]|nr:P-type conjugative transfer ATPase TrbB [Azospirillum sp.]
MPDTHELPPIAETTARHSRMLLTAFGPVIASLIEEPLVTDVLLNPDGTLWVGRQGEGLRFTGTTIAAGDADRIVRLVASANGIEAHARNPDFLASLPREVGAGARFKGLLPPLVAAPAFAIRKPAARVFTLADYVAAGIATADQAAVLDAAVRRRLNILVAGGTGSGKTTLANALLAVVGTQNERVLILEEKEELQCAAADVVALRTVPGVRSLCHLVRAAMHFFPQRIVVGEILGAEALDLLKAWNSGHPGGVSTIHANSTAGALTKLVQFVQEVVVQPSRELIAEAVDLVVFITVRNGVRRLRAISAVRGIGPAGWDLRPVATVGDLPQPEFGEEEES